MNYSNEMNLIELFSRLSKQEKEEISSFLLLRKYKKGEVILIQGERNEWIFLLFKGDVQVFITHPEAGSRVIATLKVGAFFGEASSIGGLKQTASIKAVSDVECFIFNQNYIYTIRSLEKYSQLAIKLMIGISSEIINRIQTVHRLHRDKYQILNISPVKGAVEFLSQNQSEVINTYGKMFSKLPIFKGLGKNEIEFLLKVGRVVTVKKGQFLYEISSPAETIYCCLEGVFQETWQVNNQWRKGNVYSVGEIIGFEILIKDLQRISSIFSRTNSKVLILNLEQLRVIIKENKELFSYLCYTYLKEIMYMMYRINRNIRMEIT